MKITFIIADAMIAAAKYYAKDTHFQYRHYSISDVIFHPDNPVNPD